MGEFVFLKPNSTVSGGGPVFSYPSGLPHEVLADNNDLSYVAFDSVADFIKIAFEDLDLLERKVWGVWLQSREYGSNSARINSNWGPEDVALGTYFPGMFQVYAGRAQYFQSPIQYKDWLNEEWTAARLTQLTAHVQMTAMAGAGIALSQLLIGVYLISKPAAAILSGITPSRSPLLKWAYSGFGEAQASYRIKIFNDAQIAVVGFTMETAEAVYDSGERVGSTTSFQMPDGYLDVGTTYYAAIQVSKDYNFNGATDHPRFYSDWKGLTTFTTGTIPVVEVVGPSGSPAPLLDEGGNPILDENGNPITAETDGSGIITHTTRPVVEWTVTDVEGDDVDAYEVVGFVSMFPARHPDDPTDARAFESGIVESSETSWRIEPSLVANASYEVWVRVRQGSDGLWSEWDNLSFSMNVTTPDPPVFNVIFDPSNSRVELVFDPPATGLLPTHFRIQKLIGETWSTIRGLEDPHPLPNFGENTYYDHETPPGTLVGFRATSVLVEEDGDVIDTTPVAFQGTLDTKVVWLKDPLAPFGAMTFPVQDVWLPRMRHLGKMVHQPIGRTKPVIVRGVSSSESLSLTFTIIGRERYNGLMALLETEATLLLQSSKGQWYFEVMAIDISEHLWDELHEEPEGGAWKVSVQCQEVGAP